MLKQETVGSNGRGDLTLPALEFLMQAMRNLNWASTSRGAILDERYEDGGEFEDAVLVGKSIFSRAVSFLLSWLQAE